MKKRPPKHDANEHSPRCKREQFAVGFDWMHCGKCSVDAAQEIVQGRYARAGVEMPGISVTSGES